MWLDHWVVTWLAALAVWTIASGLDDLFIGLVYLLARPERKERPEDSDLEHAPERRIAIFLPLWHEHAVIGRMLERNLALVRYSNYTIFAGVYPNDEQTQRAVREAGRDDPRVQVTVCGHAGPTSKGDCLNWIFRGMQAYEARHGVHFETVVTHDAEDLIHPDSLRWINWYAGEYEMVQVPVLPLPTGFREPTHGLYCDEFAEYQSKDIPVRQFLGGFLPSNGVGTGFSRDALDRLAEERGGNAFDPTCLTEDYENGYRFFRMGCRQVFLPIRFDAAGPIATREYFPRRFRAAVRQRSRWVAGIVLQGWERHGWRAPARQLYWFWRDRKGLLGNLLSPFANSLLIYGLAHREVFQAENWVRFVYAANLAISAAQAALRIRASARIFGWRFASGVPLRMLWGNGLNCIATVVALKQFFAARARRGTLAWRKTEHVYPTHREAVAGRIRLGELLVRLRCLSQEEVESAAAHLPPGVRLGEYLVQLHKLEERTVYRALSIQADVPLGHPGAAAVDRDATRILPADFARRQNVLPYRLALGQLHILTSEVPSGRLVREMSEISSLTPRFRLVRPAELAQFHEAYLPPAQRSRSGRVRRDAVSARVSVASGAAERG